MANDLAQWGHLWGLASVCDLEWICMSDLLKKVAAHIRHLQAKTHRDGRGRMEGQGRKSRGPTHTHKHNTQTWRVGAIDKVWKVKKKKKKRGKKRQTKRLLLEVGKEIKRINPQEKTRQRNARIGNNKYKQTKIRRV